LGRARLRLDRLAFRPDAPLISAPVRAVIVAGLILLAVAIIVVFVHEFI